MADTFLLLFSQLIRCYYLIFLMGSNIIFLRTFWKKEDLKKYNIKM